MADIYGTHFEFNGVSSRKYGMILANVSSGRMMKLYGDIESMTIFNKSANKRYLIGTDYSSSPVSFEVEIVNAEGRRLEPTECRQIEKWLFKNHEYSKLYLDTADDYFSDTYEFIDGKIVRNYLRCRFINPEKLEYQSGVVGFRATLEADSNMFWQDELVKSFSIGAESASAISTIDIFVDTDLNEYVYPKVNIKMGRTGGDITIVNNTDDSTRLTKFIGIGAYSTISLNGELNYVSGQYYEKFCNRNFIRLLDGTNILTLTGGIDSIDFTYSARRMM